MTPAASVSSALPPPSQGNAGAADGRRAAWCLSAPRRDDLTRTGVARHLPLKGPTDNVPARVRKLGDLWAPLLASKGRFRLERYL